jgi:hypothetical protein
MTSAKGLDGCLVKMRWESHIDRGGAGESVRQGAVTLTGPLQCYGQKRAA